MKITIDDLGTQAQGDTWLGFRHGFDPRNGREIVLGALSRGGFMIIDPVAGTSTQVRTPAGISGCGWGIAQAPDGTVYQTIYAARAHLLRWNWQGTCSEQVREFDFDAVFTIDVAPDGRVFIPAYSLNTMHAYDPATGAVSSFGGYAAFGAHIRDVCCAADGWVYVSATDFKKSGVVALNPANGATHLVEGGAGGAPPAPLANLVKDGAGRVLACVKRWGRQVFMELRGGRAEAIDQGLVQLNQNGGAMAFADGSHIAKCDLENAQLVSAAGEQQDIPLRIENSPLRIFSVAAGGDWIWGGTFIPLTLFGYNVNSGETRFYGNPTSTGGEIYNMLWSNGKLFMGSYTGATLTRFDPARAWLRDGSKNANPADLGRVKNDAPHLQRPKGRALGPDGSVYFSALGGYGCEDSGICRIHPETEEVSRWLYPARDFNSLCHLDGTGQLLVAERRRGEDWLRLTRICPETGAILSSLEAIRDIGEITALLPDGGDLVYGLHNARASIFAYSISRAAIVERGPEMDLGDHCHESLLWGPDGRIWGLTNKCVYAVGRDLRSPQKIADYPDHAQGSFYRFGMAKGADGNIYFPNGTHLMRVRVG